MNYLVQHLKAQQPITIHKKATRNFIDVDDIRKITLQLIDEGHFNRIINLAYPTNYTIPELVDIIEGYFKNNTEHLFVDDGSGYDINIPEIEDYFIKH